MFFHMARKSGGEFIALGKTGWSLSLTAFAAFLSFALFSIRIIGIALSGANIFTEIFTDQPFLHLGKNNINGLIPGYAGPRRRGNRILNYQTKRKGQK